MTKNEHVYTIFSQPEIAGDVISGGNEKTVEGYAVLNCEAASCSSFRDIKKNYFVTAVETEAGESMMALSENAFAFRLKIRIWNNNSSLTDKHKNYHNHRRQLQI